MAAEAALTARALSRGAVEVNPLLSFLNGAPWVAAVVAVKLAGLWAAPWWPPYRGLLAGRRLRAA